MSKYEEVEELKGRRDACSCGHKLFIIVPEESSNKLYCHCFMCGEVKYEVIKA